MKQKEKEEAKNFVEGIAKRAVFYYVKNVYPYLKEKNLNSDYIEDMTVDVLFDTIENNLSKYLNQIVNLKTS
jgi:hypothetical protein